MFPPLEAHPPADFVGVGAEQADALAERGAEVGETCLREAAALGGGELGEGNLEVLEGTPAIASREPPAQPAERGTDPLRAAPAQRREQQAQEPQDGDG